MYVCITRYDDAVLYRNCIAAVIYAKKMRENLHQRFAYKCDEVNVRSKDPHRGDGFLWFYKELQEQV